MIGYRFTKYLEQEGTSLFDRLLELFKELLIHTSGDVSEALSWLTEIDKQHNLTTPEYGIADFIQELEEKGYTPNLVKMGCQGNLILQRKWNLL